MGVLLVGNSGAGKSDLALRLMGLGAELVADDRSDLFVLRGRLYAKAPAAIAGLMEVRGVGILSLPFAEKAPIGLVVQLGKSPKRLPERDFWHPPAALALKPKGFPPAINLHAFEASAPEKLLVAAAAITRDLYREDSNPI
jgi:energy-coupling factor transporter ATP-binding protein EcfA2